MTQGLELDPASLMRALAKLETAVTRNQRLRDAERAVLAAAVTWHASIGTAAAQVLYDAITALLAARKADATPQAPTDPQDVP
jgi:hypothetical protein